jgi:hypothetical protein
LDGVLGVAAYDIRRLQAFGAFEQFELYYFAFIQSAVSVLLDHGEMNKHVLAGGALDESVSFSSVEPLHCTLLFIHANSFRLESKNLPRWSPGWFAQNSSEVSDRVEPSRNLSDKRKAAFAMNVPTGGPHDKIGMRSLSTNCDSKQEPQPRKLSCRISTVLEEFNTRHASICSEGMIFRDKGFCKAEVSNKIDLIGNQHR